MSRTQVRTDPGAPRSLPAGRVDVGVLEATTERDIALQQRQDDAEAMHDVARFARRIDVPPETVRSWEQVKRIPMGAARALLRVLDKAPETALRMLT